MSNVEASLLMNLARNAEVFRSTKTPLATSRESLLQAGKHAGIKLLIPTPVEIAHVRYFLVYPHRNQKDITTILIRSMISIDRRFHFESDNEIFFGIHRSCYGLGIEPNTDGAAPLREAHGFLLPDRIFATPPGQRIASCVEFSLMLTVFLRQAGIKAYLKGALFHTVVVADLDGKAYELDVAKNNFRRTDNLEGVLTDNDVMALYYHVSSGMACEQKKYNRSLEYNTYALELNPNWPQLWINRADRLQKLGRTEDSWDCANKALELFFCNEKDFSRKEAILSSMSGTENGRLAIDILMGIIELSNIQRQHGIEKQEAKSLLTGSGMAEHLSADQRIIFDA
jgi:tetratricopeptide (TPR) repeat protein